MVRFVVVNWFIWKLVVYLGDRDVLNCVFNVVVFMVMLLLFKGRVMGLFLWILLLIFIWVG